MPRRKRETCTRWPALAVGIPTLSRADLLHKFWSEFPDSLGPGDRFFILDNGQQEIDLVHPQVEIVRTSSNLGVAGSWNRLAELAFVQGDYDAIVLAQDDIRWKRLAETRKLLVREPSVGLFLSHHSFSVQVLRRTAFFESGGYDPSFFPCFCEDDDFALTLTRAGIVYERFDDLAPEADSTKGGTSKNNDKDWAPGSRARNRLVKKWGANAVRFYVNHPYTFYYHTNRGLDITSILGLDVGG